MCKAEFSEQIAQACIVQMLYKNGTYTFIICRNTPFKMMSLVISRLNQVSMIHAIYLEKNMTQGK